jgi:hypothetical protein
LNLPGEPSYRIIGFFISGSSCTLSRHTLKPQSLHESTASREALERSELVQPFVAPAPATKGCTPQM